MYLLPLFSIQKSRFFRTHILCYFWPCNTLLYLIHLILMGGIFSQRKIRKNPCALVLAKAGLSLLLGLLLFYLSVLRGFLQAALFSCSGGGSVGTMFSDLYFSFCLADRGILMAFRQKKVETIKMNSMDRHIQQTNDRLQCIKQVS